jgi:hypothetical protein
VFDLIDFLCRRDCYCRRCQQYFYSQMPPPPAELLIEPEPVKPLEQVFQVQVRPRTNSGPVFPDGPVPRSKVPGLVVG